MRYLANHELIELATPNHIRNVVDLLVLAHNESVKQEELLTSIGQLGLSTREGGRQAGIISSLAVIVGMDQRVIRSALIKSTGFLQARHDLDAAVVEQPVIADELRPVGTEDDWQPRTVHKPTITEDEFIDLTGEPR